MIPYLELRIDAAKKYSTSARANTRLNCKNGQCGGRCLRKKRNGEGIETCRLELTKEQKEIWGRAKEAAKPVKEKPKNKEVVKPKESGGNNAKELLATSMPKTKLTTKKEFKSMKPSEVPPGVETITVKGGGTVKNPIVDTGNTMYLSSDWIEGKQKDASLKKAATLEKRNGLVNRNVAIVIETGVDKYAAIDDGFSPKVAGVLNEPYARIIPNNPKQIELAKALRVPDKNETLLDGLKMFPRNKGLPGNLSDVGSLMHIYDHEITSSFKASEGHDASEEEIERVAKQVRKDGKGHNWVPVLVRETGEDKYEVVGNHFVYDVMKKANVEKMWTIIVE